MLIRTILTSLILLVPLVAQAKNGPHGDGPNRDGPPGPARIHIIGASVSGGFQDGPLFGAKHQGQSVTLQKVLKKWGGEHAKVTTHPPMEMWNLFRDPLGIGKKQIDLAMRKQPDLVVAVDFPFWFAYGYVGGAERIERLALLDSGLAFLAKFQVPVIIGDLPNFAGAAKRMMPPSQIPSPDVLVLLNERLKKFADEHDNVTLVSMTDVVRQLKVDGAKLPLADGELQTPPAALLQEDRLHATRLGIALLVFKLQDTLRGRFSDKHPLHLQKWAFEQFVEAAGAVEELEELQDQAAAKK